MSTTKSPTIESYDRDTAVAYINKLGEIAIKERKFPELADREGRKKILARLGFDSDTKDDYRLVQYEDSVQMLLFKARKAPDGAVVLMESMVLPERKHPEDTVRVSAIVEGKFKKLPRPIELPSGALRARLIEKPVPGEPREVLELTPDQARRLTADVTLLALAEGVGRDSSSEPRLASSLPMLPKRSPGISV